MTQTRTVPPGGHLDAGTGEKIFTLFAKGAISDQRLCELYEMWQPHRVSWPKLSRAAIVRHRQKLSNDLRLTTVAHRGEMLFASTENLEREQARVQAAHDALVGYMPENDDMAELLDARLGALS